MRDQVVAALAEARHTGWDGLLADQRAYLDDFWDRADVELEGDAELQQAVRFALFHALQAGARAERRAIAGEGPDRPRLRRPHLLGHRALRAAGAHLHRARTRPPTRCAGGTRRSTRARAGQAARPRGRRLPVADDPRPGVLRLLAGRHRRLPHQRRHRRRRRPLPATPTSDDDVRARGRRSSCWSRRRGCGARSATTTRDGRFRIDGVTGPDEYSAIADNNVYTNLMAQRNLRAAADAVARHPRRAAELGVDLEEAAAWRDAAATTSSSPTTTTLGVHPQAEGFTEPRALGLRATRRPTSTRCCCTSPTSTSTASRWSSRPTSCSRCTGAATRSPPRRRPATSPTTSR